VTLAAIGLRNLLDRPARSGLAVSGVAVACAAWVVLVGVSSGLERSWVDSLRQQGTDMLAVQRRTVDILTATLDAGLASRLASVAGVTSVAGELVDLVELETGDVLLVSGWQEGSHLWRSQPVLRGRLPGPDEPDGAAIGLAVAEALRKDVGDAIEVAGRAFRVTGILGETAVRSPRLVILPLQALQEALGKEGKVTVFSLQVAHAGDGAAVADLRARLSAAFPTLSFSPADHVAEADTVLRLLRAFAWGTSTVALALAVILVVNTLLMSVMERTREIGVLSAVGWSQGRVAALLIGEGILVTLTGGVLGASMGLGGLALLARLPRTAGVLITHVTAATVVQVAAAALALGALASGYPAWRAARMPPVDALRNE